MTTLLELIETPPAAGDGLTFPYVYDSGAWRGVFQIADPSAGSSVVWHDLTAQLMGYQLTRGAGGYDGRCEATVANIEVKGVQNQLAPYNGDTSPTFGTHVELGSGLLARFSLIRVSGGVVVEWLPRFTLKVEYWGDAAHARGKIRRHLIVARDTFTSLVDVPVPANDEEDWSDRVVNIITDAGWQYGLLAYHDYPLLLPARDEQGSASTELDATLDPVGLVWHTDRYGHLVIRPRAGDTLHGAVLSQPLVHFHYAAAAAGLIAYAVDSAVAEPVGICKSELAVKNRVVITSPAGVLDLDDALSIQRFDPKVYRASWLAANDPAADQFLGYRKFAQYEATPFITTLRQPGFHDLLLADWLYPAEIDYRASADEPAVNATGVVRRLEESARFYGELAVDMSIRSTVDIGTASDVVFMLPVEDLAVDALGDTSATFSWSNPGGQPVTPTHTQFRLIGATTIWTTAPYPIVGLEWEGLTPATAYQLQVRLVEITDGVITTVSPVRVVSFTTTDLTTPGAGDGSGDVDVPDYGACSTDWRLFEWDPAGDEWDQVASGTTATPPVDVSAFLDPGKVYRMEARENCSGVTGPWVSGPAWIEPDDWGDPCMDPPALGDAPFDDADLVAYVFQLCAPATLREAVSHNEAEKGPAFQLVTVGSDGRPRAWSTNEGRVLQGYAGSALATLEDDATLCWRGKIGAQPAGVTVLASFAGLELAIDADGSGFGVQASAYEQTGGKTTIFGATEIDLDAETYLNIVHNEATDTLKLYIGQVEEASAVGTVGLREFASEWYCDLPADSWLGDVAVFARALAAGELPGPAAPSVTIDQAAGQADPATASPIVFDVVFSEAVTGFATGDVTLSGTAGATTAVVAGSGTTYTVSVTGMTGAGTVIASIAAGVCVSVANGIGNQASTSSDNTVTWAPFNIVTSIPWAHLYYAGGPQFATLGHTGNGTSTVTNFIDEITGANAANMVNGVGGNYYASVYCNGKPSVFTSGAAGIMHGAVLAAGKQVAMPFSIIWIGQPTNVGDSRYVYDGANAGSSGNRFLLAAGPVGGGTVWGIYSGSAFRTGGVPTNAVKATRALFQNGNDLLTVNGSTVVSGSDSGSGSANWQGLTIGGIAGAPMSQATALWGIYAGDITAHGAWAQLQAWVLAQYGVSLS